MSDLDTVLDRVDRIDRVARLIYWFLAASFLLGVWVAGIQIGLNTAERDIDRMRGEVDSIREMRRDISYMRESIDELKAALKSKP